MQREQLHGADVMELMLIVITAYVAEAIAPSLADVGK